MKRIIGSGVMMMAVLAVVITGTGAFFSDSETSEGNVFTAGSIDLMVNHTAQSYNDVNCSTCETSFYSEVGDMIIEEDGDPLSEPFPAVAAAQPATWADETTLSSNAQWIWGVGDVPDENDDTSYTFQKEFTWYGNTGNVRLDIDIAADDDFVVTVNGQSVSVSQNQAWTDFTNHTAQIGDELVQGQNTIEFEVTNSGGFWAGLVYELTIEDLDCVDGVAGFQDQCELWDTRSLTSEKFFQFNDIKPQDEGTNLISMTVEDNESYICLAFNNIDEIDSDQNSGQGSMGNYLEVAGWVADADGNASGDELFGPQDVNSVNPMTYADSSGDEVTPGETQYMLLAWCYGDMELTGTAGEYSCDGTVQNINDTQGEQLITDLQFFAIQSRNNGDFTCDMAEFGEPTQGD